MYISNNVFVFQSNDFVEISPLIKVRFHCSSLYIPLASGKHDGLLLVAGSCRAKGKINGDTSMEYLMINNDFRSNAKLKF